MLFKGLPGAGLIAKLRAGLSRTQARLGLRLREVFSGRTRIDDELYAELEAALIEGDLGPRNSERLLARVAERVRRERIEDPARVREFLREEIEGLLRPPIAPGGQREGRAEEDIPRPFVSLVVGVNGAGKTTTIGKLAQLHRAAGRSVVICAADTFRAAAIDQIAVWAERAGARLVRHREGADPAAVVYDALETAAAKGDDIVLVDTAGRLHTKDNLMSELEKVRRVVGKRIPGAPHEVLLILDATTGQNALAQAREFGARAGVTGLIVTKIDGTAKGGVVVAVVAETGLPVHYLGTGEAVDDLVPFDARAFAEALLFG